MEGGVSSRIAILEPSLAGFLWSLLSARGTRKKKLVDLDQLG